MARKNSSDISAADIEVAVMERFDYRKNLMVPNIQAGMDMHECDMLMLKPSGYATEFEFMITSSDLRKDLKKEHGHLDNRIKEMYYAVPDFLAAEAKHVLDPSYGIVMVRRKSATDFEAEIYREAKERPGARKWTDEERLALARLGTMRIFKLKAENNKLKRQIRK